MGLHAVAAGATIEEGGPTTPTADETAPGRAHSTQKAAAETSMFGSWSLSSGSILCLHPTEILDLCEGFPKVSPTSAHPAHPDQTARASQSVKIIH